jgi:anti-sigma factor RsiW
MSCEAIENQILDYQENQLSPAQREALEIHLATCAGCRAFARQLQQLDTAFSARMIIPVLSADFDHRLRERIRAMPTALPTVLSEAQRAERKRQLQDEFETGIARIRRGSFAMGSVLKHLFWPALASVTGWLVWCLASQMTTHLNAQSLGGLTPDLLPWLAASAAFLAIGLAGPFRRQFHFPG